LRHFDQYLYVFQPVETNEFELVYSMDVKNERNTIYKKTEMGVTTDDIEGFAIWYLNHQPKAENLGANFGFKPDFNGLGVFVFKHERNWRILSIYNEGMNGLSVEVAVNNLSK
jgi:hypothetical protein